MWGLVELVKNLMEGEEGKEIRKRMNNLRDTSANALKEDGSSIKALSQVADKWKKNSNGIC